MRWPYSNVTPRTWSGMEIKGAYHNDFAYDPTQYADKTGWTQDDFDREFINQQVNLFMRKLYEHVLSDQTNPGDLELFLLTTTGVTYNSVSRRAAVDPFKLVLL